MERNYLNLHSCSICLYGYALNLKDCHIQVEINRVKRIWYLSPMGAAKVQASLRIHAVSPEPSLLAHTSSESRDPFRQKARSVAPLNGWACAVEICHDGMLEDTNSLDGAHILILSAVVMRHFNHIKRRNCGCTIYVLCSECINDIYHVFMLSVCVYAFHIILIKII